MKLSAAEEQHLMDLVLSGTDRERAETARLVECGLAISGRARFGTWAKATAKGTALTKTWSREKQLQLMSHPVSDGRKTSRGATPRPHREVANQAGAANHALTSAGTTSPTAPLHTGTVQSAAEQKLRPAQVEPANPTLACSAAVPSMPPASPKKTRTPVAPPFPSEAKQVAPNAVRVTLGAKVVYYPLSSWDSLDHVDKTRCYTTRKFYRPYPLAAPEGNEDIPR